MKKANTKTQNAATQTIAARPGEQIDTSDIPEITDWTGAVRGLFARPETREVLKRNAITVFLQCDLETVLRRVPLDGRRPLAGNREIMRVRLAERESSYREADVTVDGSVEGAEAVAERVVSALRPGLRGDATQR